jgi:hypothetical protein
MDGLIRSVGNGISGLVVGALDAIGAAISGTLNALGAALPAGAMPVLGIAAVLLLLWFLFRR